MSYDTDKLEVKNVQEGYNILNTDYVQYHQRLNDFDTAERRRFLPRDMSGLDILDLGAGDGRTFHFFSSLTYNTYTACDISQSLLSLHPCDHVKKIVADLDEDFPFDDNSFDIIISFFLLEHIDDLEHFFGEIFRVLRSGGRWIFTLFPQRREFIHKLKGKKFKIKTYPYHYDIVERLSDKIQFSRYSLDLFSQNRKIIGKSYCLVKE